MAVEVGHLTLPSIPHLRSASEVLMELLEGERLPSGLVFRVCVLVGAVFDFAVGGAKFLAFR